MFQKAWNRPSANYECQIHIPLCLQIMTTSSDNDWMKLLFESPLAVAVVNLLTALIPVSSPPNVDHGPPEHPGAFHPIKITFLPGLLHVHVIT
jgi:hypothetical protein